TKILSNKIAVFVGEVSYSLYLWHWPIMAFIRYNNNRYQFTVNEILVVTILTFLFGYLSYTLIENKFRYLTERKFLKIFIPLTIVAFIFSFFLPRAVADKEIPKMYSAPDFGLKSHETGQVERFG